MLIAGDVAECGKRRVATPEFFKGHQHLVFQVDERKRPQWGLQAGPQLSDTCF